MQVRSIVQLWSLWFSFDCRKSGREIPMRERTEIVFCTASSVPLSGLLWMTTEERVTWTVAAIVADRVMKTVERWGGKIWRSDLGCSIVIDSGYVDYQIAETARCRKEIDQFSSNSPLTKWSLKMSESRRRRDAATFMTQHINVLEIIEENHHQR
jgi:hypothetical protein